MIREKQYRDFSADFHDRHAHEPIVIQMELTYRCPLRCRHCYSDCFNNPLDVKRELDTKDMRGIIDRLYDAGSLWLCFTGGDPMMRPDFLDLYDYAKERGFILTIFTSLIVLNDEILTRFKESPPFSIETTLNAATKETYEKISRTEGSFDRAIKNIEKIIAAGLPLKIKTLLTTDNWHERQKIGEFIGSLGLDFQPGTMVFAGLNGDTTPCRYRIPPEELLKMDSPEEENCGKTALNHQPSTLNHQLSTINHQPSTINHRLNVPIFRCAIGNWQYHIDPYGRLVICSCVREPSVNVLKEDLVDGAKFLSDFVKAKRFTGDSECKDCGLWHLCSWCPGRARLEMGDEEAPIPYFCELAKKIAMKEKGGRLYRKV